MSFKEYDSHPSFFDLEVKRSFGQALTQDRVCAGWRSSFELGANEAAAMIQEHCNCR